jgi:hypothetical protein
MSRSLDNDGANIRRSRSHHVLSDDVNCSHVLVRMGGFNNIWAQKTYLNCGLNMVLLLRLSRLGCAWQWTVPFLTRRWLLLVLSHLAGVGLLFHFHHLLFLVVGGGCGGGGSGLLLLQSLLLFLKTNGPFPHVVGNTGRGVGIIKVN